MYRSGEGRTIEADFEGSDSFGPRPLIGGKSNFLEQEVEVSVKQYESENRK
jgi:hypothetical protein